MSSLKMRVVYAGGKSLQVTDSFEGLVQMLFTSETLKKYEPLKIAIPSTGKVLYYDKNQFSAFYRGEIKFAELIDNTVCDDLYLNWLEIEAGGIIVEPGALWKLKGFELTLIDDDQYITYLFPSEAFKIVE